jgi:hypothetical protein
MKIETTTLKAPEALEGAGPGEAARFAAIAAFQAYSGRLLKHAFGGSLERHLLHASNRLAFAVITASIVVGSAIVIGTHAGPHFEGVPLLGIIGVIVAAALGVAWAVIALKSGRL